jgi:hypothetical protein
VGQFSLSKTRNATYINVAGNFNEPMRLTITFFLAACILGLTYWAWTLTTSMNEYDPLVGARPKYEDIKKIMNSTDIEFLRQQAIGVKFDEKAIERHRTTVKAMIILGVAFLISMAVLILLFFEIAARGKNYREQKL